MVMPTASTLGPEGSQETASLVKRLAGPSTNKAGCVSPMLRCHEHVLIRTVEARKGPDGN